MRLQELTSDPAAVYADKSMPAQEKVSKFLVALVSFLQNEPAKILRSDQPLKVSDHATYGKLKATLLTSCTCPVINGMPTRVPTPQPDKPPCFYHCDDLDLKAVMYEICRSVHSIFGDSWATFVNVFFEETVSGRMQNHKRHQTIVNCMKYH